VSELIPLNALARLIRLRSALRVMIVNGPRQAGKTTLVRLLQEATGGSFRSLDDEATLAAAIADPRAFVTYGETLASSMRCSAAVMPWCWLSSTRLIETTPVASSSYQDRLGS
jgi:chloramphenicol 3-O-phosphotransferase